MSDLTAILERLRPGDPQATAALFAQVYEVLRRRAGRQVRDDGRGEALPPPRGTQVRSAIQETL
jgi:hypothetical protein